MICRSLENDVYNSKTIKNMLYSKNDLPAFMMLNEKYYAWYINDIKHRDNDRTRHMYKNLSTYKKYNIEFKYNGYSIFSTIKKKRLHKFTRGICLEMLKQNCIDS